MVLRLSEFKNLLRGKLATFDHLVELFGVVWSRLIIIVIVLLIIALVVMFCLFLLLVFGWYPSGRRLNTIWIQPKLCWVCDCLDWRFFKHNMFVQTKVQHSINIFSDFLCDGDNHYHNDSNDC
jgi:hypothetical protein